MSTIAAAIFDLDGCLVDREPHSPEAIAAEFRAIGHDIGAEEIRNRFLGVSMTDICRDITDRTGMSVPDNLVDRRAGGPREGGEHAGQRAAPERPGRHLETA